MAILEWQEEIAGDGADLVETEWDAKLDKRLLCPPAKAAKLLARPR